jgi:putative radical SAM enzyme (TIGR03279 family)
LSSDTHRTVAQVAPGSIAEESGIQPGDVVLSIDGKPVLDRFDYRTRTDVASLVLRVRQADGLELEVEIEKDEDEDLGLAFDDALMDECGSCRNDCVFCFIRQLPDGMRPTLYFRDDDLRMSFLSGNYVTLTNLDEAGMQRLIDLHLSPVNVSVHTTDPALRVRMMGNRFAGRIMEQLARIVGAGIRVNAQIVLCRGWNDGEAFDRTMRDLDTLGDALGSIAAVPVGLTRYRDLKGLPDLLPYDRDAAREMIARVDRWRATFMARRGTATVHASDEMYLRADLPIPAEDYYEDYPQLENGVGIVALFRRELAEGIAKRRRRKAFRSAPMSRVVHVATGTDAAPFLAEAATKAGPLYGVELRVHPVANRFFGETVTVAGLVTGADLVETLRAPLAEAAAVAGDGEREAGADAPRLLVPSCMLKADEAVFLDGATLPEVEAALRCRIAVALPTGAGLLEALDAMTRETREGTWNG